MKKARLLRMSEMTPIQQLVYEMLPVGQDDYNNVSRTEGSTPITQIRFKCS